MIAAISGFPDNVVACAAKGRVTRADYRAVIVPGISKALERHRKIRCYYELGADFAGMDAGAIWEDLKIGIAHLTQWERVAVVTDVAWIGRVVNAFRFLVPGAVRVFANAQATQARAWITAP